ncbi:hypothetical protein DL771_004477 [Monosporascus sp. 5C6A]|nr:hypothetical protein DL771_004477 [Monosporascus sp. 5C6A]
MGEHTTPETLCEQETPEKYDDVIAAVDDTLGGLTVGFELEVLFPALRYGVPDPHPFEHGAIYEEGSADEDIPRHEFEPPDDFEDKFDRWLVHHLQREMSNGDEFRTEKNDLYYPPHNNVPRYDTWRLTKDASLSYDNGNPSKASSRLGYAWMSREITSEVLSSETDGNANNSTTYAAKITSICGALRRVRVHLNETTSVHVHVGRGDEAFSLRTVKKFPALLWLTDAGLLGLQHPARRENEHCRLVTLESVLAAKTVEELRRENSPLGGRAGDDDVVEAQMLEYLPTLGTENILGAQLRRIWGADGVEELARLMKCSERTAVYERGSVGFTRFLPAGKTGGNTHTFEWRQMAGCLDPQAIIRWAGVCIGFTNFARLSDAATYKTLVTTIIQRGGTFTGLDLLEAFGLQPEACCFRQQVADYERGHLDLFEGQIAPTLTLSIVVNAQAETNTPSSKSVQPWVDEVAQVSAGKTASPVRPQKSPLRRSRETDSGYVDQPAPEIPLKSPLRSSRNREGKDSPQGAVKQSPFLIPKNSEFQTPGRVKRLTAAMERNKNLSLRFHDLVGPMEDDHGGAPTIQSS